MTTELEKQFFDTFELTYNSCTDNFFNPCRFECDKCPHCEERYPQITDSILLELIVIMTQYVDIIHGFDNLEELKTWTLEALIYGSCDVKHQVRTLFEEG